MNTSLVVNFNGQGQEAIKMYTEIFGLEQPEILTYASFPKDPNFPISEEEESYVVASTLKIGNLEVLIQDLVKSMQYPFASNVTISIGTSEKENVIKWFNAMADGGQITCPLQVMPWSPYYGAVKDKFGTSWQFQMN